jgi:hypothetical protein
MMWPWQRRRIRLEREAEIARWEAFQDEMRRQGWLRWEYHPPPRDAAVQAHRFEWDCPSFFLVADVSPLMNVANLYWRLAGPVIDVTPQSGYLH